MAHLHRTTQKLSQSVFEVESQHRQLEQNLPLIIKEILDHYLQKKEKQDQDTYCTQAVFREKMKLKLDTAVFQGYQKQQVAMREDDRQIQELMDQIHTLDRKFQDYTPTTVLNERLEPFATQKSLSDLNQFQK